MALDNTLRETGEITADGSLRPGATDWLQSADGLRPKFLEIQRLRGAFESLSFTGVTGLFQMDANEGRDPAYVHTRHFVWCSLYRSFLVFLPSFSYAVFLSLIQRYIAIFQMQPTSHTYESAASAKGAPGSSGKSYANSNNVIWTSDQSKYLTSALGSSQVEYRRIVDVQYSTKTGQTTTSFVGCAKTVTKTTRQRRRTQEPGKSDVTRQKAKGGGKTGAQEPGAKVAMNAARKGFASLSLPPEGKCTHVYFTGDNGGVPSDGEVEARLLTVTVFNDVKDGSGALRDHLILTVLSLQ